MPTLLLITGVTLLAIGLVVLLFLAGGTSTTKELAESGHTAVLASLPAYLVGIAGVGFRARAHRDVAVE
jgi:NhaP-type Na+/H+ or K+/H+ antiporter